MSVPIRQFRRLIDVLCALSGDDLTDSGLSRDQLEGVRRSWQDVLGIDDSFWLDQKYTDLVLNINWLPDELPFHALHDGNRYVGIPGDVIKAMGDPEHSKEAAGAEIDTQDLLKDDAALVAEVQTVLASHGSVVAGVSSRETLVEDVNLLYTNDLYYRDGSDGGANMPPDNFPRIEMSQPLSNDDDFERCYRRHFQLLLGSLAETDTMLDQKRKILGSAQDAVDDYIGGKPIAVLYNASRITSFERSMWNIVQSMLEFHTDSEYLQVLVSEYSQMNPIIPLLKPKLRAELEAEEEVEEIADEIHVLADDTTNDIQQTAIIPLESVVDVVETALSENPGRSACLSQFPALLGYYVQILERDGKDVMKDDYYRAVSSVLSSWIDGDIVDETLDDNLEKLARLPLVDTQDATSQELTLELREAQFYVDEAIRLRSQYFGRWRSAYCMNKLLDMHTPELDKLRLTPYLKHWRGEAAMIEGMDVTADAAAARRLKRRYLNSLILASDRNKLNASAATTFQEIKWFEKWRKSSIGRIQDETETENTFALHHVGKQCLDVWQLETRGKGSTLAKIYDGILKRIYFESLKLRHQQVKQDEHQADVLHDRYLKLAAFKLWKSRSSGACSTAKLLAASEKTFVLAKHLGLWKRSFLYSELEFRAKTANAKHMKRFFLTGWQNLYALNYAADRLSGTYDKRRLRKYFDEWVATRELLEASESLRHANLLRSAWKQWSLQTYAKESEQKVSKRLEKSTLEKWRLNARAKSLQSQQELRIKRVWFDSMLIEARTLKEQKRIAATVSNGLALKACFRCWKKRTDKFNEANVSADQFSASLKAKRDKVLRAKFLKQWKKSHAQVVETDLELEERYMQFLSTWLTHSIFKQWKERYQTYRSANEEARFKYDMRLVEDVIGQWEYGYTRVMQLEEMCDNEMDLKDGRLLSAIMSRMSLKYMKYQTDYHNADMFKVRWQKNDAKTFFDLWKIKLDKKLNPDAYSEDADRSDDSIVSNPYRESYTTSTPFRRLSASIGGSDATLVTEKLTPPRLFETPLRRRMAGGNNDATNSELTSSARRMRRSNLQQRADYYRQVRTSPRNRKTGIYDEGDTLPTPTRPTSGRHRE